MRKKVKNNLKLGFYFLILITIMMTATTFAKYQSTLSLQDQAKVGLFAIKNDLEEVINLDIKEIDPDHPVTYTFYVQNYNETGTSEVNMTYKISLENKYGNLPLKYQLYKGDVTTSILDEKNTYQDIFYYDKKERIKFTLIISMPRDAYEFQDLVDCVTLHLEAIQID